MTEFTDYNNFELPEPFNVNERNEWGRILNDALDQIDDGIVRFGPLSDRPEAEVAGRLFLDTGSGTLYRDDGDSWEQFGSQTDIEEKESTVSVNPNTLNFNGGFTVTEPSFRTAKIEVSDIYLKNGGDTMEGVLDMGANDLVDDTQTIWDASSGYLHQTALQNDDITVTAGDGLKDGGLINLGGSATLNIEPADFAGTFLTDDGADNLQVDIGRGLENDGAGNIRFDEDVDFTFTQEVDFDAGLNTRDDIEDGAQVIWDASIGEIPDSAMGSIDNATLTNSSVTVNANDGLVGGGNVALGGSIGLDIEPADFAGDGVKDDGADNIAIEPADFAGLFLSDDGTDDLRVDIGRGLEDDGTGAIQFDEDTGYTFTAAQNFDGGITVTGTVSLPADSVDSTEADIGRGLEDDGTGAIQFDEDTAYTFTVDQKVNDEVRHLYGTDDDYSISYNSTSGELEIRDETNNVLKASFDKNGDVFIPNGDLAVSGGDIRDGTDIIWDTTANEIPDSAMGSIENATLTNDSITVNASDGLKSGGPVALGGTVDLDIEPADFAGQFLQDNGAGDLEVLIGSGLEDDGTGSIRFDQDLGVTWTSTQTFNGGVTLGSEVDAASNRIRNLPEPTNDGEAARKSYVDGVAQGLNLKDSVRVATDETNIDLTSATDPNPVDGVTLNDGDRVLLKDQTDATENGIYVANTATDPTTWARSADSNEDAEVTNGLFTFVTEGTSNASTSFIIVTEDPITLGTTAIEFAVFSTAGEVIAGDGLLKDSQTYSVLSSDLAGQFISEDGSNNLQVNIGRGLESDGSDNIRFDEDIAYTFSQDQIFNGEVQADQIRSLNGVFVDIDNNNNQTNRFFKVSHDGRTEDLFQVNENGNVDILTGDITDGTNVIYDATNAWINQARLENDSITVNANDGLKSGGTVALGGSVDLNIEPADFAGSFLGDDGGDNLEVLIGRGLENDGTGNIRFDEDVSYTFTSAQTIQGNLDLSGNIELDGNTDYYSSGSVDWSIQNKSSSTNNPLRFYSVGSNTTILELLDNGNADIPNGTLTVSGGINLSNTLDLQGNDINNVSNLEMDGDIDGLGVDINIGEVSSISGPANGATSLELRTQGDGAHDITLRDGFNNQDLLVAEEGGNVTIPSGSLTIQASTHIFEETGLSGIGTDSVILQNEGSNWQQVRTRDGGSQSELGFEVRVSTDSGSNWTTNLRTQGTEVEIPNGDITSGDSNGAMEVDEEASLADAGKAQLSRDAKPQGYAMIQDVGNDQSAMVYLGGAANTVEILHDSGSGDNFSTVEGQQGTTNIYYDATNTRYEINNETGGSTTYSFQIMKA